VPDHDIEIIDTHVHAQPSLTDGDVEPDPKWFRDLFANCRHRTRLLVSCDAGADVLMKRGNVAMVRAVARLVRAFPDKLVGTMMLNPCDIDDALEAMELGVKELGMRCVGELCQYIHNYRTDGPEVVAVVQKAIDLDVAVLFHSGADRHVEGVAHIAAKFPRARIMMAHCGGSRCWRRGIETVRRLPNVSLEVMRGMTEQIGALMDTVGPRRITYGTDFFLHEAPELRYERGNWLLDCLKELKLKDADIERICSGNAKELLKLED